MTEDTTEALADQAFEDLRKAIGNGILEIPQASQQDSKAIQSDIRFKLTEMRANIRLVEEFAEEQDRYGLMRHR